MHSKYTLERGFLLFLQPLMYFHSSFNLCRVWISVKNLDGLQFYCMKRELVLSHRKFSVVFLLYAVTLYDSKFLHQYGRPIIILTRFVIISLKNFTRRSVLAGYVPVQKFLFTSIHIDPSTFTTQINSLFLTKQTYKLLPSEPSQTLFVLH